MTITDTLVLPEAIIHHIQSFMTGKEAARSSVLSKSWYVAWLTRPTLEINNRDFRNDGSFEEFWMKAMRRYRELGMKIESFKLTYNSLIRSSHNIPHNLIVGAMEAGATDLELEFSWMGQFKLPREVLGSKTLLRLSLHHCEIDEDHVIRCSRLKSLSLEYATIRNPNRFKDILTSCRDSLEELALSYDEDLNYRQVDLYELHNLRRLSLEYVDVRSMSFADFGSKFPCLKDLKIINCSDWNSIHIASTTLENIRFTTFDIRSETWKGRQATFNVPNIRKFTYGGCGLPPPSLIKGGPGDWELDMSASFQGVYETLWFSDLTKFRPFRITSLRIHLNLDADHDNGRYLSSKHEVGAEGEAGPVVAVERLVINATPSSLCCKLLIRLLRICRPKFVSHNWDLTNRLLFKVGLCKRLMQQEVCPCCGVPNEKLRKVFGLKKVNMEVYEKCGREWQPLVLEKPVEKSQLGNLKVGFVLIWD